MPIKAINLEKRIRVVSKYDAAQSEADGATVWVIGALDSATYTRIKDSLTTMSFASGADDAPDTKMSVAMGRMNYELVAAGLRGWENFLDEKDAIIAFATQKRDGLGGLREVVRDDLMKLIPAAIIEELAAHVKTFNTLSQDELGNSGEPLTLG